ARAELATLEPQRVGRADRAGARVRLRQRKRALLVRNGDVGADKAAQRKPEDEILELVGRYRLDDVAARDAERPQPVMMDQRRARMRGRPSDQARGGGFCSTCHARHIRQAAGAVNDHGPETTIIDISQTTSHAATRCAAMIWSAARPVTSAMRSNC